eukprot:TRINITY_DN26118_c0_g1_i1.p1 TRINITY_DN26118_c0_g1~~TRINITY_DN26118_c0_g1_i1.p1  ORF type:complete len:125 (-),score=13.61 TRINITY_DN26118_c0_g1_i1:124-456(-)
MCIRDSCVKNRGLPKWWPLKEFIISTAEFSNLTTKLPEMSLPKTRIRLSGQFDGLLFRGQIWSNFIETVSKIAFFNGNSPQFDKFYFQRRRLRIDCWSSSLKWEDYRLES